ncbi:MAG: GDP-mannose 4,6-dehydratase [Thermoplasmata archaeon]
MSTKKALITAQDGSYLAEFLLENTSEVYGLDRRLSGPNLQNSEDVADNWSSRTGPGQQQLSPTPIHRLMFTAAYH